MGSSSGSGPRRTAALGLAALLLPLPASAVATLYSGGGSSGILASSIAERLWW